MTRGGGRMPAAAGIGGPDRVGGQAPPRAAVAPRMAERPNGRDRAVLVEIDLGAGEPEARLAELKDLAASAGAEVADIVTARRARPDPALFAGRGKIGEIAERRVATDAIWSFSITRYRARSSAISSARFNAGSSIASA